MAEKGERKNVVVVVIRNKGKGKRGCRNGKCKKGEKAWAI